MIKNIPLPEFIEQISEPKIKLLPELETSKLISLVFIPQNKRRFLIHVSKVYELIKDEKED